MKPNVVFFGESISEDVKARSCVASSCPRSFRPLARLEADQTLPVFLLPLTGRVEAVKEASQLLVMGTSLATYSAFRCARLSFRLLRRATSD